MPLSSKWTRLQLRNAVRRELLDPNGRWWSDSELNQYINDWQNELQSRFEFTLESTSTSISTATVTLSTFTSVLKPDRLYWNNVRLPVRVIEEMNILHENWRTTSTSSPYVAIPFTREVVTLWPTPSTTGTLTVEGPKRLSFAQDSSPMDIPAWTRYSAIPYCTYRAYLRPGTNHSLDAALTRKAKWERYCALYRNVWDSYFPYHGLRLQPGNHYEANILNPQPFGAVTVPAIVTINHMDEVPTGTIDGLNSVFTLSYVPNPTVSLKIWVDGVLLTQNTHYTLSSSTITFINPYQPRTNQTLFANYRYTS